MTVEKENEFKDFVRDGQLYLGKGLYNKALLSLQRAYMIKKDDFELNYLIARTFYLKKDYVRAKKVFADLMEIKPDDENIKLYMAYIYFYTGRPKGRIGIADSLNNDVLKINDKNLNAIELKADISMFNRDYAGALIVLQQIKSELNNPYRIVFKEAICYYFLNNTAETLRLCTKLFKAGLKKSIPIKKLYKAAKARRKAEFNKSRGKMSWTQKLFAFLFDTYVDRTLPIQTDTAMQVEQITKKETSGLRPEGEK